MKRKVRIISIIFLITMLIITTNVKADSFKFIAEADKTQVNTGDTITIEFGVSNINAGESGINAIEAMLEYDL